MKKLFRFKYPKILGLVIAVILAYVIFRNPSVSGFVSGLGNLGYVGVFIAGMFFTFGFSSPFSAGFFITLNPENILFAAVLGGLGALIDDLLIFNLIRFSFMDEFERLERTKVMKKISYLIDKDLGNKIKLYLMYAFAGILIASPLPDEAGIIMLSGLTRIKQRNLAIISFLLNTIGIWILLYI